MSEEPSADAYPSIRHRIWLDVLAGLTIVLWGAAIIAGAITVRAQVVPMAVLLAAACTATIVAVQIGLAAIRQRRDDRRHREVLDRFDQLAESRWTNWADALAPDADDQVVHLRGARNGR